MPRRGPAKPRRVQKDPLYGDLMLAKLVNRVMRDGKKSVAQKQVYKALEIIKGKGDDGPLVLFHRALANIRPSMEVRSRRVGGAAYQVPMPVRGARQDALAIRWMIEAAQARDNSQFHTFGDKLAAEIMEAEKEEGGAVKKKMDMERVAEANRAFAHFRW